MVVDIFFGVSFCILLAGMVFIFKVPQKMSLVHSLIIAFISELCIGGVVAKVYFLFNIPICLANMGVAYIIVGSILWIIIMRQKRMQTVALDKEDIYIFLIPIIGFCLLFLLIFTPNLVIAYSGSDSAEHYSFALRVLDTGKISSMYYAELFNGLVMNFFQPFLTRMSLYKGFIIADALGQLIHICMVTSLVSSVCTSHAAKRIFPFMILFYYIGWPLYCYSAGFSYQSWGVTLFAYIIYMLLKFYKSNHRKSQILYLILVALGYYSIIVCYLLYAPVAGAVIIVGIVLTIRNKFKVSFRVIIGGSAVCIGMGVILLICLMGFVNGRIDNIFQWLQIDGGIHKDLYRDFVPLMPGVFYLGLKYIKNRKCNLIFIFTSIVFIYIIGTLALTVCGIMSSYYFYKSYYLLWMLVWILNVMVVELMLKENKDILIAYCGVWLMAFLITFLGIDNKLEQKGLIVDANESTIYPSCFSILDDMENFYIYAADNLLSDKNGLIDVCVYINESTHDEDKVVFICDAYILMRWYNALTERQTEYVMVYDLSKGMDKYIGKENQYIVMYQNSPKFWENGSVLEDFECVYNNGFYGVYKIEK